MHRRLKQGIVVVLVLFVAAQLIRPSRANPATDPSHSLRTHPGTSTDLAAVLDRSCGDCHSNATTWPWYTQVAPLSWVMSYAVKEGRKRVNFSEWTAYSPENQRGLLAASCRSVSQGTMPGSAWTSLHPEARLSPQDVHIICAAAQL